MSPLSVQYIFSSIEEISGGGIFKIGIYVIDNKFNLS